MKKLYRVNADALHVRTGGALSYSIVKLIYNGAEVIVTEEKNGWGKHNQGGWSSLEFLTLVKDYEAKPNVPSSETPPEPEQNPDEYSYEINGANVNNIFSSNNFTNSSPIDEMRQVLGMPAQFIDIADPHPDQSSYGRKFLETMIDDGSFLFMTPGKPEFFKGINKKGKNVLKSHLATNSEMSEKTLTEIMDGQSGKYYSFKSDYVTYMDYVNAMCRMSAIYLGIGDRKAFNSGTTYANFDWSVNNDQLVGNNKNNPVYCEMTYEKGACFYIDGKSTSFSMNASNNIGESMVAGSIGSKVQDGIRELRFLTGNANVDDKDLMKLNQETFESSMNEILSKLAKGNSTTLVSQWTDYGKTAIEGGNISMPEMWKDSSTGKSYSIEMKLVAPYADDESIYLNILVPLFHWIGLAYPRQLGRAGYMSPFIIRGFCKGWFNCNMGIIDSISFKFAAQDGWAKSGIPTEVDVSVSLRDLYETIAIGRANDLSCLRNTEFIDMIGTMSGVNINKPDLHRQLALMNAYLKNKTNVFTNMNRQLNLNIKHKLYNMIRY